MSEPVVLEMKRLVETGHEYAAKAARIWWWKVSGDRGVFALLDIGGQRSSSSADHIVAAAEVTLEIGELCKDQPDVRLKLERLLEELQAACSDAVRSAGAASSAAIQLHALEGGELLKEPGEK
jgi:hypothetical protein